MQRIYSFDKKAILYLVATPIGNLEDMTIRAINILKSVSYIYAEDTRNSMVLLNHYEIKTPLLSYHDFNKELKNDEIISRLQNNESIAIISDAGLPVISDPGYNIALLAIENNIPVTTIPGACAFVSALVSSGLPPMPHMFYGFLDSKKSKRCEELKSLASFKHTLLFYEAPHRIVETLSDMLIVFGDRHIVIGRELTKKFEEYIRGSISEIIDNLGNIKGEIVLLVSGNSSSDVESVDLIAKINDYISIGMKPNDAIKEVSLLYSIDRKDLYNKFVKSKNN